MFWALIFTARVVTARYLKSHLKELSQFHGITHDIVYYYTIIIIIVIMLCYIM